MAVDSFRPITTEQRLAVPVNGYLYTTTRDVAAEKSLPTIGGTMEAELGPAWANSRVITASVVPNNGKRQVVITHARIPSVAEQIANCKSWTHTTPDIGGQKFSGISITLVMLASEYSETSPAIGSVLNNLDPGAVPSQFAESSYILESRASVAGMSELEPTFRAEKRNFIKRATMTQNDFDEALGGNLQSIQTLYYRGESVTGAGTAQVESVEVGGGLYVAHYASAVLQLVTNPIDAETITINEVVFTFKDSASAPGEVQIGGTVEETRATLREAINNSGCGGALSEWNDYSAIYTHGTIGSVGNDIEIDSAMTGIGNFWFSSLTNLEGGQDSSAAPITATFTAATGLTGSPVSVTIPTYDTDTPEAIANRLAVALDSHPAIYGKALASVSGRKASLTYRIKAADSPTDSLTLNVGSTGLTATSSDIDGVFSADTVEALFADKANSFWGVQGDGTAREGQQLSDDWFVVTRRQVVPSKFAASGRSYFTTEDHLWPAVLERIQIDTWPRKEGGSDMITTPIYAKDAYRGPCRAYVEERFYLSPPPMEAPNIMLPLPIDLQTPIFGLNIGPTLHTTRTVRLSTGTNHPVYEYTVGLWVFPATNYTDWPASVVASDECRPFRGGYLKTKVTIYRPA